MSLFTHLECSVPCGAPALDPRAIHHLCVCGAPLLARYDLDRARAWSRDSLAGREPNMWRYRELLPLFDGESPVTLGEGFTPLFHARALGSTLGLDRLYIKDESLNPTNSFKARGQSAAITRARALGAETVALYQADSGLLDIKRANSAHISRARALGVTFRDQSPARRIVAGAGHVEVHTDDEVFAARTLTICAGSWTPALLADLGVQVPIALTQEQVSYFAAPDLRPFAPGRFPVWIFHGAVFGGEETSYYGFPVYGEAGVKLGRDVSGRFVTQETRSFEPNAGQTEENAEFLRRYLPGAAGPELLSKTCVYDLPPDRNFVIDTVPGYPHVSLCIGAGHAAKFAGLLGHALADLAIDGATSYGIGTWKLDRPALVDPGYPTDFRMATAAQAQQHDPWQPRPKTAAGGGQAPGSLAEN